MSSSHRPDENKETSAEDAIYKDDNDTLYLGYMGLLKWYALDWEMYTEALSSYPLGSPQYCTIQKLQKLRTEEEMTSLEKTENPDHFIEALSKFPPDSPEYRHVQKLQSDWDAYYIRYGHKAIAIHDAKKRFKLPAEENQENALTNKRGADDDTTTNTDLENQKESKKQKHN